jgi:hypothetical protein
MAHAEAKKKRILLAVKNRAEGHSLSKAFRLISDVENISVKTISSWWYHRDQVEQRRSRAEEKSKPDDVLVVESEVAGTKEGRPRSVREEPAQLLTDGGQLRCSRCKSTSHIEKRDPGDYFCTICQVVLMFSGFLDEGPMQPYFPAGPEFEWMR